ncbi:MAG: NADH-quinone oxidoreductase subunit C [Myxococcota bacterium]
MSKAILDRVVARFPDAVVSTHAEHGDETVLLRREALRDVMTFLRDDSASAMSMLTDVTCVDYLGRVPSDGLMQPEPRFELVYHLYSIDRKHRLRVKARVPEEDATIDTLSDLWKTANWLEREVWDLYGVRFRGHPDLRRILLYEEFVGHPLRKDYPVDKRQPLVRRTDVEVVKRPVAADIRRGALEN